MPAKSTRHIEVLLPGPPGNTFTFGYTTIGSSQDENLNNIMEVSGPFFNSQEGTLTDIFAYLKGGNVVLPTRAVIYTDSGGNPSNLVVVSSEVLVGINATPQWFDFPCSHVDISDGNYWIGLWFGGSVAGTGWGTPGQTGRFYFNNTGINAKVTTQTVTYSPNSNPPVGFPTVGTSDATQTMSIYASLVLPPNLREFDITAQAVMRSTKKIFKVFTPHH